MKGKNFRLKRILSYEALLMPALFFFMVFFIIPLIMSIFYSFTNLNLLSKNTSFVGFENYLKIFKDTQVLTSIKNTLVFAFSSALLINIGGMLIAILLDINARIVNAARMLIFIPAVISPLLVGYIWSYILSSNEYGLANSFLSLFGVAPLVWFGSLDYALFYIILIYVWQWTGWAMVIYLANLQSIPNELYESAEIDGANSAQKIFRITIPLLATSTTINAVMFMIAGLKIYDVIIATTEGGPGYATESFTTVIVKKIFGLGQYGYGSSIAVVLFMAIILVTLFILKYLNNWERKVT